MNRIHASAAFALLCFVAGCSQSTPDADSSGEGESDVVGVEDLGLLEGELGLVKDQKKADGTWGRSDARLQAGGCWQKAHEQNPQWELRRYVNGAAFFPPRTGEPGMGDSRALTCVDIDIDVGVQSLDGVALDAVMRFHLGKPTGLNPGMMHVALTFEHGMLYGQRIDAFCGTHDLSGGEGPMGTPPEVEGNRASSECWQEQLPRDVCDVRAEKACEAAAKKDVETPRVSRPSYLGVYVWQLTAGADQMSAVIPMLAERWARKKAKSADVFNMAQDPLGALVRVDHDDVGPWIDRVRFARMDIHHYATDFEEKLAITPKSSDPDPLANAVVVCRRPSSQRGDYNDFDCEAAGGLLAP